jgi:hypothetical protein
VALLQQLHPLLLPAYGDFPQFLALQSQHHLQPPPQLLLLQQQQQLQPLLLRRHCCSTGLPEKTFVFHQNPLKTLC